MSSMGEQKGLSLDRLQTLCLVAEKGGVMAAAAGNPNRQSLYSRQLRELEAYFGAPLIDRSRTPHSLTGMGRQVEKTARGFFNDMEVLVQSGQSGRVPVMIGAGESVIQAILIPVLLAGGGDSALKLIFRNLQSAAILSGLRNRRLDLGIAHDSGGHADLKSKRLLRYGVRLITANAKLARKESVSWDDLEGVALALPEGDSELRRAVDDSRKLSRTEAAVECTTHAQVLEAVATGAVAGIVPEFVAAGLRGRAIHAVKLRELEGFSRELRVLWHPAAVEMKPQLERLCGQLFAASSGKSGKLF